MRASIVVSCLLLLLLQSGCATRALWDWHQGPDLASAASGLGIADEVEAVAADESGRLLVAVSYTGGRRYLALCPGTAPVGTSALLVELIDVPRGFDTPYQNEMTQEDFLAFARALAPDASWTSLRAVGAVEDLGAESFRVSWGRLERRQAGGGYEVLCELPGEAGGGDRAKPRMSRGAAFARLVATPFTLAIDAVGLPLFVVGLLLAR